MSDDIIFLGMNLEEIFSRSDQSPLPEVDWALPPRYDEYTEDGFLITTECDVGQVVSSKDLKFVRDNMFDDLKCEKVDEVDVVRHETIGNLKLHAAKPSLHCKDPFWLACSKEDLVQKVLSELILLARNANSYGDLDLALRCEKPAALTDTSSAEAKSLHEAWERSNRLGLMFMRMTIVNNIKTTLPDVEDAKALSSLLDDLRSQAASGRAHLKFVTGNTSAGLEFQTIYGLMQCTPDLSNMDCNNCLQGSNGLLNRFRSTQMPNWKTEYNMVSWRVLLLLYLILLNIVTLTVSQPNFLKYYYISGSGSYSTNSTYQKNLVALLSSLSNSTDKYGFYSSSVGENPDRVNAIVLCRGDVDLDTCRSCINNATMKLPQLLPNYKAAIGWYRYCMLRYSDESINSILATNPSHFIYTYVNASSVNEFNRVLRSLLDGLRSKAASGGARRKFATNDTAGPDFQNIYGLMQCTPDLSEIDCNNCLQLSAQQIPHYFGGETGGTILAPSCTLRYETYQFFAKNPADAPPPTSVSSHGIVEGDAYMKALFSTLCLERIGLVRLNNTSTPASPSPGAHFCSSSAINRCDNKASGYMAPEYAVNGQFSVKSDVFSFGVLILEILSGRKNNSFYNGKNVEGLLGYAWKSCREGTYSNVIDPALRVNSGSMPEMIRCIHIGLLCVQESVAKRPAMAEVVLLLNSSSISLEEPSEPGFFLHSGSNNAELPLVQEHRSEFAVSGHSINEVTTTELYPR
ncbi:hypothetical protein RHSIM_Rhsim07G0195500 [Rhododendron simsii]|uniref:Gnk2-homologous domain-containing protein n=1 Tax=Rhododendron simsii TaxID=118357 RepID=A0A834LGQ8_RHOSS|nr:hypothetical protein RHSIM_Rhsim07G0195500 [Rhododendron simsii]